MKLNVMMAAAAALLTSAAMAAPVYPGGDLGTLTKFPTQFLDLITTATPTPFVDSFKFTLTQKSEVIGSVAAFGTLSFTGLFIDGLAPTIAGTGFSAVVLAGMHTLSLTGGSVGFGGYSGSVYATSAPVPEPESLALALAGVGVTFTVMRRRNRA